MVFQARQPAATPRLRSELRAPAVPERVPLAARAPCPLLKAVRCTCLHMRMFFLRLREMWLIVVVLVVDLENERDRVSSIQKACGTVRLFRPPCKFL